MILTARELELHEDRKVIADHPLFGVSLYQQFSESDSIGFRVFAQDSDGLFLEGVGGATEVHAQS